MAEFESALGGHIASGHHGAGTSAAGVVIQEITGRDLLQVGAWPADGRDGCRRYRRGDRHGRTCAARRGGDGRFALGLLRRPG